MEAYEKGQQARARGKSLLHNPYECTFNNSRAEHASQQFERGWMDMDYQIRREMMAIVSGVRR